VVIAVLWAASHREGDLVIGRLCIRLLIAGALAFAAFGTPLAMAPARADNIGGTFSECAQLAEFVAPSDGDNGHLTLIGIGPGLYNDVGDEIHHRFPFSATIPISQALVSQLTSLADGQHFTCIRMTGDGAGIITAVALDPQVQVCGTIARDALGIFSIDNSADSVHMELLAEAGGLVEDDANLTRLLNALIDGPKACLDFQLGPDGVVQTLSLKATFSTCGRLQNVENLLVGSFVVANADSTSEALIPPQSLAAASLVMPQLGVEGCVDVEVAQSRIVSASLTASGQICGSVVVPEAGNLEIDGAPIPAVLLSSADDQQLRLAAGGSACLSMSISANIYDGALSTTPLPASAAPTTVVTPSATPVAAAVPPAQPGSTPVGLLLALIAAAAIGLGALGFLAMRRMRRGPAAPAGGMANAESAGPGPAAGEIARFTPREQEVLSMLYGGMSNKEIGARLFITESTAGVHVSNIMTKLGAKSRSEAAAVAHRMGLTSYDGVQH
jgi:DNA-binding CsgD family transcriptional regulator